MSEPEANPEASLRSPLERMTTGLYPKIITPTELDELTNNKLSKARAIEIKNKVNELKRQLSHYKKCKKRWKNANKIVHGIGVGIGLAVGGTAAAVGIIGTSGVLIPIAVPVTLATVGAIETVVSESIAFALIKKKIHRFNEKINILSLFANRMYLLFQKAIEDRIISLEELQEFQNLVKEYECDLEKLNLSSLSGLQKIEQKLEKKAEVAARDECTQELLDKLKEEKKNELKSKFQLN